MTRTTRDCAQCIAEGRSWTSTISRLKQLGELETLSKNNKTYREIYDRIIASRGGLLALLDTPPPAHFDYAMQKQIDHLPIISD